MSTPGVAAPPPGEPLEELLRCGPPVVPIYLSHLPASTERFRAAVLLGVLALGPEVVEVVRERLRRRDSPEKWALLRGLGEVGHPEAEGYFHRVLRERQSVDGAVAALQALGNIRGSRSLGAILAVLEDSPVGAAACAALARFETPEADAALGQRMGELSALRALAVRGSPHARDAFVTALAGEPEWAAAGAEGLGRLGDPEFAEHLVPLLQHKDATVRRAAFEAYALLGAPLGTELLLAVAGRPPQPWMLTALGQVTTAPVAAYLASQLTGTEEKGLLRRLFSRVRLGREADRRAAARALRGTTEPAVLEQLGVLLLDEPDPVVVRHLLAVRGLLSVARQRDRVAEVWRRGALPLAHAAGVALLQNPTGGYLGEVLAFLARPGFCGLDSARVGADPEHLLRVYASDNNPALLVSGFVDSGFVDLTHLVGALGSRLAAWSFPADTAPSERFSRPGDCEVGGYLQALGEARPAETSPLWRLWDLLAQLEAQGDTLLDLFLSYTEAHRGGLQRALFAGFSSAVAKFLEGKRDRDLPELDALTKHLPAQGALVRPLREVLERARTALKRECRDMALVVEGTPRGDLVLIEKL